MLIEKYRQRKAIINRLKQLPFIFSVITVFAFFYDMGFENKIISSDLFYFIYTMGLIIGTISIILRYFIKESRSRLKAIPFEILLLLFFLLIINQYFKFEHLTIFLVFDNPAYLYVAIFLLFFREASALKLNFKITKINPAQLFLFSFLFIIIIGGLLLILPNATYSDISVIDALFTSTSAVCVTGLVVVDTGSFFTEFGQIIILVLIQIGGIGIMTFASYFSFFFRGVTSYENQLTIREMTNTEKISEVFSILKKIILVTILVESIGTILIFQSLVHINFTDLSDRIYFSIFHSVSGFCNAGFSTLNNSLFENPFQFNYPLQITIAGLIIVGGLGFPIVFNLLKFLKIKIANFFIQIGGRKQSKKIPWIININSRIVVITTLFLILFGTIFFFLFEYNNTLRNHSLLGKIVTAFFCSVTTRTAGFNTIDTAALSLPSTLIVILFMWIGASPGSTGGGIKTSTFAIAILNILSIAKGKTRLEIFKREISGITVNRSFAIIVLSFFVISISIFLISLFDSNQSLLDISFESISAYSTVGLSRGITSNLSIASKFVLILTMFIGRVSMLTVLIAILKKIPSEKYRYPSENILIN
jgi:potassium uptake TrkH family protein